MWDVTAVWCCTPTTLDFYSHIPCGMWLTVVKVTAGILKISTHTSRVGCDTKVRYCMAILWISTHTSRVGCDRDQRGQYDHSDDFYSHIPCGMWRRSMSAIAATYSFLLTHPVWDVTDSLDFYYYTRQISTHTSRVGCDPLFPCHIATP